MEYQKQEIKGAWLEKSLDLNEKKAKLVSETKPDDSGKFGTRDVSKIQLEGETESYSVNVNKPTVNALIDAFGTDSKNWCNQPLTIHTEKAIVSGKRVIALYLVPEGFELAEDDGGYLVIGKKNGKPEEEIELPPEEPTTPTF